MMTDHVFSVLLHNRPQLQQLHPQLRLRLVLHEGESPLNDLPVLTCVQFDLQEALRILLVWWCSHRLGCKPFLSYDLSWRELAD